jgi:hypothetical protein
LEELVLGVDVVVVVGDGEKALLFLFAPPPSFLEAAFPLRRWVTASG